MKTENLLDNRSSARPDAVAFTLGLAVALRRYWRITGSRQRPLLRR